MSSSNDNSQNMEWCFSCEKLTLKTHLRKVPLCGHQCCRNCYFNIQKGWSCKCAITELPIYEAIPWIITDIDWDNVSQRWLNTHADQCLLCGRISIHANFRSLPNCGHKACLKCYFEVKRGFCCFCWYTHPYNIYFEMKRVCESFEE